MMSNIGEAFDRLDHHCHFRTLSTGNLQYQFIEPPTRDGTKGKFSTRLQPIAHKSNV